MAKGLSDHIPKNFIWHFIYLILNVWGQNKNILSFFFKHISVLSDIRENAMIKKIIWEHSYLNLYFFKPACKKLKLDSNKNILFFLEINFWYDAYNSKRTLSAFRNFKELVNSVLKCDKCCMNLIQILFGL